MKYTAAILVFCLYFVSVLAMPRTVPNPEVEDVVPEKTFEKSTEVPVLNAVHPKRVACEFVDVTEDEICMKHCIPKGYTYGVCVSKTCTCI